MIQKATWIIPGILVTLLLGLLWAMPAFAADAGDISFLDSDGDEISYLSLNGLGSADDPITIQVEDQDLNAPTKYTDDVGAAGRLAVEVDGEVKDIDWTDLADMNGDGKINANDIGLYDDAEGGVEKGKPTGFVLDITNGKLMGGTKETFLEFHLNEQTTIGAFVSARGEPKARKGQDAKDDEGVAILNTVEFAKPTDDARLVDGVGGSPTWLSVLTDPDGDGDFAEHLTATATYKYDSRDSTDNKFIRDGDDEEVTLLVSVTEDDATGKLTVRVSGVTFNPDDDYSEGATPTTPVLNLIPLTAKVDEKTDITITYKTVYQNMGTADQIGLITLDSSGSDARVSVALKETSASSGVFRAMVKICDSEEAVAPNCKIGQDDQVKDAEKPGMVMLPVNAAGDTITLRYRDAAPRTNRSSNISLDINPPAFSNLSPDSGTAGKDAEPDVSYEVVDGESGIADDADSIRIVAALFAADAETDSLIDGPVVLDRDDLNVDELTDGFSVEARLREGESKGSKELDARDEDEYEIRWWAVAVDVAGNTGVSDSDSGTQCTYSGKALGGDDLLVDVMAARNVGTDDEESCDPHVIRVDTASPTLVAAKTGVYLDGDDEKTGSATSIVARFDEALDCDTVAAGDFEVDGASPNDVTCDGKNVYLDVDEIDSNDTPDVEVAEEAVSDRAGNMIGDDAEVEATDGIPAGISVTVVGAAEGDRPIAKETITITISSDERLSGRPIVEIRKIGADYSLGSKDGGTAAPTGAANEWELEEDLDVAGLYNVYVTAEDRVSSDSSSAGLSGATSDTAVYTLSADKLKSDSIILFEVDNNVSAPEFTPENEESTDDENVFIRVNFSSEGNEYGLGGVDADATPADNTREATDDPAKVVTDFDTSGTVTLISASFNGADVTDDVITRDNILFVYRPGNLTDGDHKLELKVEDSAGNEDSPSVEFSKVARKPYKLELNPGQNLVSFPGNPEDGDINAVFGGEGNEDILSVLTFNNSTGLWRTATKGADGAFMGDLTNINGMNGYWVVSDGIVDISVVLAGSGDVTTTPPHIAVNEGWNLIGVVDTGQRQSHGIATSDYFANVDAQVVYGFNSLDGKLVRLSTATLTTAQADAGETQDMVETGMGYWVYANEAGIIIP